MRPSNSSADYANVATRTFAEPLIDCDEDRTLREALAGHGWGRLTPSPLGAE
jgi:hypothetical protein